MIRLQNVELVCLNTEQYTIQLDSVRYKDQRRLFRVSKYQNFKL